MKAIIKALLKSKIGKAILAELLKHFMLKLKQKIAVKNAGTVNGSIINIALTEIEREALEEFCENDIHSV